MTITILPLHALRNEERGMLLYCSQCQEQAIAWGGTAYRSARSTGKSSGTWRDKRMGKKFKSDTWLLSPKRLYNAVRLWQWFRDRGEYTYPLWRYLLYYRRPEAKFRRSKDEGAWL